MIIARIVACSALSGSILGCTYIFFTPLQIAVGCCRLGHPLNGQVELSNTTVGSTANYTCNQGYILSNGNSTRTCQANQEWSGSPPSCKCERMHMSFLQNPIL